MKIPYYHVDAFSSPQHSGNPAGVCLLSAEWLPEDTMQRIAFENNLSETAFVLQKDVEYQLRWFTPTIEVDLCGHATLASAHVLLNEVGLDLEQIRFETKSGAVQVGMDDERLILDFPSRPPKTMTSPADAAAILGKSPVESLASRDYFFVFDNQSDIHHLNPDYAQMSNWDCLGVIVTAPGKSVDFVSRFFAPRAGVNEDPVTGSAHSSLIPYWAQKLQKQNLHALQISARGGELFCQDAGDRVKIGGQAITFMRGVIEI